MQNNSKENQNIKTDMIIQKMSQMNLKNKRIKKTKIGGLMKSQIDHPIRT